MCLMHMLQHSMLLYIKLSWEPASLIAHSWGPVVFGTVWPVLCSPGLNLWKLCVQLLLLFLIFNHLNCLLFLDNHDCYMNNIKISKRKNYLQCLFLLVQIEKFKKMPTHINWIWNCQKKEILFLQHRYIRCVLLGIFLWHSSTHLHITGWNQHITQAEETFSRCLTRTHFPVTSPTVPFCFLQRGCQMLSQVLHLAPPLSPPFHLEVLLCTHCSCLCKGGNTKSHMVLSKPQPCERIVHETGWKKAFRTPSEASPTSCSICPPSGNHLAAGRGSWKSPISFKELSG